MKQIILIIGLLMSIVSYGQFTAGFENQGLSLDTFDIDGSSGTGFYSGDIFFPNNYNAEFNSWTDWAISTMRDTVTEGFTNPLSSYAGTGKASDTYAVAAAFSPVSFNVIELSAGKTINGLYITNNTYAALSMKNGDSFAKKFGGESGDDPDFFLLTIKKWQNGELSNDSINFYMADFRFEDNTLDYIVQDWTYVDVSSLGGVDSLEFALTSSDVGAFGMNTPAYFCLDNIGVEMASGIAELNSKIDLKIYPNPSADFIRIECEEGINGSARIYDTTGRLLKSISNIEEKIDVRDLHNGSYVLFVQGKGWSEGISFIKR